MLRDERKGLEHRDRDEERKIVKATHQVRLFCRTKHGEGARKKRSMIQREPSRSVSAHMLARVGSHVSFGKERRFTGGLGKKSHSQGRKKRENKHVRKVK